MNRLRIISGSCRGMKLDSPDGPDTRPTADRVKEALFSMLTPYIGADTRVLDMFAGTGGLGLEAVSRGAQSCVFIENCPVAANVISRNIEHTRLGEKCRLIVHNALDAAARLDSSFEIIFLDPPYNTSLLDEALTAVQKYKLLAPGGIAVIERGVKTEEFRGVQIIKERRYGKTWVYLVKE